MRWFLTAALTALCSTAPDTLLFSPPRRISSEDPAFVPVDNALFLKDGGTDRFHSLIGHTIAR